MAKLPKFTKIKIQDVR